MMFYLIRIKTWRDFFIFVCPYLKNIKNQTNYTNFLDFDLQIKVKDYKR